MRRSALLGVVALAGCGSQPGPLTPAEYCNQYAQDVCAAVTTACLVPEASCLTGQLVACNADAQNKAGLDFIPSNAQTCLDKVKATYGKLNQGLAIPAADFQAMNEVCSEVYRGTKVANASCAGDAECISGLICDKGHCGTAAVVAPGAGCANIGETCPQGFYCSGASGIWVCASKVATGVACDDALPCLENLRCVAGVCTARLGIGEDCTLDQDCSSGFCEPYALKCALELRFASGNVDCMAMGGSG